MVQKILDLIQVVLSFLAGKNYAELREAKQQLDAVKTKEELANEVANSSADTLRDYLSGK